MKAHGFASSKFWLANTALITLLLLAACDFSSGETGDESNDDDKTAGDDDGSGSNTGDDSSADDDATGDDLTTVDDDQTDDDLADDDVSDDDLVDDDITDDDVIDDDSSISCSEMGIDLCDTHGECRLIFGLPVNQEKACIELSTLVPLGCMDAEGGCGDAETLAYNSAGSVFWFSSTCIPPDFTDCSMQDETVPGCSIWDFCSNDWGLCEDNGGVCWPLLESRPCPDGYEYNNPPAACLSEDGLEGSCCEPVGVEECQSNDDCAIVAAGCCSCGLWEEEFTVIAAGDLTAYEEELQKNCAGVACEPCPPSIPDFQAFAVCDAGACELRTAKNNCIRFANAACRPSEEMASNGCPSNWGDCGCSFMPDELCPEGSAPMECETDSLGCPASCVCEGPMPSPELPDEPEMYACLSDEDCVEVLADCCLCGGASVNKDYEAAYSEWLDVEHGCGMLDCAGCAPESYTGKPICYYGHCSLEEATEPSRCNSTECYLGAPCDCDKDLYGCTLQNCAPGFATCTDTSQCLYDTVCWYGDGCSLTPNGVECNPNGDGLCHVDCSGNPNVCYPFESCYEVANSYGDVAEVIHICLELP
jgi:hypothetical protein